MASVKKISEQIMRILGRRTDDSDIDIREIMLAVTQSANEILRIRALQEKQDPDNVASSLDSLVKTYTDVEVKQDSTIKDFYIDSPADIQNLPNGGGIKLIAPMSCPESAYIPYSNSFKTLYGGLDILCAMGVGYYVDGDKIRFAGMTTSNNPSKVLVRLLGALDEDTELASDMQNEIIRSVLNIYMNYRPQDETNDQIDLV